MKGFGKRLREARTAIGMTQVELAEACDRKHVVTICRWEKEETEPSMTDITKICKALGVTSDWLLGISIKPNGDVKYKRLLNKVKRAIREENE